MNSITSHENEKAYNNDFYPFFKVHENGYIQRYVPITKIPPFDDPKTGIKSKDVIISHKPSISARIFLPKISKNTKIPILVYFHGGGFSLSSAFDSLYHNYVASLVKQANVIAVSVEYRLAPENPIPSCYEDSWSALKWVASHANGNGQESWLNNHGNFTRVFISGDSAGANICYNLSVKNGSLKSSERIKLEGMILVHPYFMGTKLDRVWLYLCTENNGLEDRRINPIKKDIVRIGCKRILIFVASKDQLRNSGLNFYEKLKRFGWNGKVNLVLNEGVGHVFHLFKPNCDQALFLMKQFVSFIKNEEDDQIHEFRCRI